MHRRGTEDQIIILRYGSCPSATNATCWRVSTVGRTSDTKQRRERLDSDTSVLNGCRSHRKERTNTGSDGLTESLRNLPRTSAGKHERLSRPRKQDSPSVGQMAATSATGRFRRLYYSR
jgi:hypothetical protein